MRRSDNADYVLSREERVAHRTPISAAAESSAAPVGFLEGDPQCQGAGRSAAAASFGPWCSRAY